ncbi:hypothetical protein BASA50_005224 [Batrachochytrium salamandrivorans]|uniref:HMG box domain-containing protein n=1 Tax=Batrachochytrium salamandrivorans TaxID=1357716 RepID=A0ABQ8FD20_9FUNG|nr:hypothetical protein BASA62_004579 [Batrachochytrium salamandrivorans]KAH6585255.1 hypothetical protein BASA60_000639 [Batrachochytrium salamandrivorans]KAH6593913.1 hypothetical protein BASA61_004132 [Batrachochytrium salamandrivorans]KAH6596184.1 hypothetical protein BASA50_005224 [Batrachochytrium salamandrivorans]KAH9272046.1 hypothetical protein BASA83_005633 [Batrachochytrium salamandrivorans]
MPRKPDGLKALSKFLESDLGEKIARNIAGLITVAQSLDQLIESVAPHVHLAAHSALLMQATVPVAGDVAEVVDGKRKRKRQIRDPNAPKRPPPSYVLFVKNQYQGVAELHPDLKPKEIMVMLGGQWRDLTDDEKRPYHERSASQREQYSLDMVEYKGKKLRDTNEDADDQSDAEADGSTPGGDIADGDINEMSGSSSTDEGEDVSSDSDQSSDPEETLTPDLMQAAVSENKLLAAKAAAAAVAMSAPTIGKGVTGLNSSKHSKLVASSIMHLDKPKSVAMPSSTVVSKKQAAAAAAAAAAADSGKAHHNKRKKGNGEEISNTLYQTAGKPMKTATTPTLSSKTSSKSKVLGTPISSTILSQNQLNRTPVVYLNNGGQPASDHKHKSHTTSKEKGEKKKHR